MYNNTNREKMDFHSVMETFAEAWVAANTHTPLTEAAEQGLINGPSNHPTSNQIISNSSSNSQSSLTLNQSVSNQGSSQPILTVLQEPPKIVIENTASIDNSHRNGRLSPNDSSSGDVIKPYKVQEVHGKCLPVHCIVEQIPGPQACGQYVELDSYAIVPSETLFSDLVRTALGKLGYSVSQVLGAKGSIKVKKWKPLAFDQITDNPEATVGDILGELTTVASLHVRLYSVPDNPQEWKDTTVRNAVLELLREMSQSKLAKTCPLSQPMLSNIINNRYLGKIGKEKCQEFGQWYLSYRKQHPAEKSTPEVVPSDRPVDGRLTFHPSKELPIMRDWFHSCRNPSRRTLQTYVDILNQGPVRQQERPKIVFSTLKNWWKNEKQRERKNQRSDDDAHSPHPSTKPKRRKKNEIVVPNEGSMDNSVPNFNLNNSQDSPPKTNNFTLINHSENESDVDTPPRKDGDSGMTGESNHDYPSSDLVKMNCKFPSQDSVMDRQARELNEHTSSLMGGHIIHPIKSAFESSFKDSLGVESPYFPKLHTMSLDHPHNLFSFPDSQPKLFCDSSIRTNIIDGSNSHLSSEDDVDVGI